MELIEGIIDFFGSIPLVDVLQRKLEVRSYREFFNRTIGIGFILTGVGLFYVFVTLIQSSGTNLMVFGQDLRGPATILAIIGGLWLLSEFIQAVNVGQGVDEYIGELLSGLVLQSEQESSFRKKLMAEILTTILYGLMLYWVLSEINLGNGSVRETAHFLLVFAVFFGVVLFVTGYFLRGVFGVGSLLRSEYGGTEKADRKGSPEKIDKVR